MTTLNQWLTRPPVVAPIVRRGLRRWASVGIQAKIVVPLVCLMILSLVGSTIGFLISTTTTRNRLLDSQLTTDARRLTDSLARSEQELTESAMLLSRDPEIVQTLHSGVSSGSSTILKLDQRALNIRYRYGLDQVLIFNDRQTLLVNIAAQSYLSQLNQLMRDRVLSSPREAQTILLQTEQTWLLVRYAPIGLAPNASAQDQPLGTVYTILNLSEELSRIRRELELAAEIQLADANLLVATLPALRQQPLTQQKQVWLAGTSYRAYTSEIQLGGTAVTVNLLRSEQDIRAIVGAGFHVMLISSSLTLVLLVIAGVVLARSFTRPILQLGSVAQAVAAGDLSRRARLTASDEIGRLSHAFDQATETIVQLLDGQARMTGELQAIVQSIADGVLAVDHRQRIVLINPAAATLLGQTPAALVGQPLAVLAEVEDSVLAASMQHIVEQLTSALTNADTLLGEERVALGARVVSLRSRPIVGSGGLRTGAVVVLQDITDAVESDRAKSDFIATASHELRTPLTGIVGYVDLFYLQGTDNLTPHQSEALAAVKRQSKNMVLLVNDLLEMARIERGSMAAERRWVTLGQAIDEASAQLSAQIATRRIKFDQTIDPLLPALWIDPVHLRRILTNLLSNAVKYVHDAGSVTLRAYAIDHQAHVPSSAIERPWHHDDAHSVVIEIGDNGVGIRAEDQAKIFTRFFRSDNPLSVSAGGTGLGLTITQALVELHGGQIGFTSTEGRGTCFWVRFPALSHAALSNHGGEYATIPLAPAARASADTAGRLR